MRSSRIHSSIRRLKELLRNDNVRSIDPSKFRARSIISQSRTVLPLVLFARSEESSIVASSHLDEKGRGVVASMLVQSGTLEIGDGLVAGQHFCRVKAMFNERGQKVKKAGPSTPVSILGFSAAPAAGETFLVMDDEATA